MQVNSFQPIVTSGIFKDILPIKLISVPGLATQNAEKQLFDSIPEHSSIIAFKGKHQQVSVL